eukprot:Rmarinus@m.8846
MKGKPVVDPLSQFVHVHRGTLPVILSVPHGGGCDDSQEKLFTERKPSDDPKHRFRALSDLKTREVSRGLIRAIEVVCGGSPFVVTARVHRKFVDMNRAPDCFAYACPPDDPLQHGHKVYTLYHETIEALLWDISRKFAGTQPLLLDIHGHNHSPSEAATIFVGTRNGTTVSDRNRFFGVQSGFIEGLRRACKAAGGKVYPSRAREKDHPSFSGGYTVMRHGMQGADGRRKPPVDAIQLEIGQDLRGITSSSEIDADMCIQCTARVLASALQFARYLPDLGPNFDFPAFPLTSEFLEILRTVGCRADTDQRLQRAGVNSGLAFLVLTEGVAHTAVPTPSISTIETSNDAQPGTDRNANDHHGGPSLAEISDENDPNEDNWSSGDPGELDLGTTANFATPRTLSDVSSRSMHMSPSQRTCASLPRLSPGIPYTTTRQSNPAEEHTLYSEADTHARRSKRTNAPMSVLRSPPCVQRRSGPPPHPLPAHGVPACSLPLRCRRLSRLRTPPSHTHSNHNQRDSVPRSRRHSLPKPDISRLQPCSTLADTSGYGVQTKSPSRFNSPDMYPSAFAAAAEGPPDSLLEAPNAMLSLGAANSSAPFLCGTTNLEGSESFRSIPDATEPNGMPGMSDLAPVPSEAHALSELSLSHSRSKSNPTSRHTHHSPSHPRPRSHHMPSDESISTQSTSKFMMLGSREAVGRRRSLPALQSANTLSEPAFTRSRDTCGRGKKRTTTQVDGVALSSVPLNRRLVEIEGPMSRLLDEGTIKTIRQAVLKKMYHYTELSVARRLKRRARRKRVKESGGHRQSRADGKLDL